MTRRMQALSIGNFKAFADTQRIPIKPITLLFGPNSAGKSSFIHSLAMAHEAQFGREKRNLSSLDIHHTEVGGSSIDLGGFRQYVHRGQLNKRVEWGAEIFTHALGAEIAGKLLPISSLSYNIAFGMELDDQDRPKQESQPLIVSVDISVGSTEILHASRRPQGIYRIDRINLAHPFFQASIRELFNAYDPGPAEGETSFIASVVKDIELALSQLSLRLDRCLPAEVVIPESLMQQEFYDVVSLFIEEHLQPFLMAVSAALESSLESLQYLGPLRSFPPRHMAFVENEDINWYAGGGYAWDVVRRDNVVRESVNGWLSKLKTPYKLEVRTYSYLDEALLEEQISDIYEGMQKEVSWGVSQDDWEQIKPSEVAHSIISKIERERLNSLVLVDQRTNTTVTHRDVGIGISQVLPVLVMAYGSNGKLLAMEQPEIHLHPALQAELGDVFIEAALGERQNTFILETHSEHLILRLMRRIREGKISPDDVGVVFVEPLARGSRFIELRIDEEGDFIDEWPGGFFEESFHEKFGGR